MSSSISPTTASGFSDAQPAGFYTVKNEKVDEVLPQIMARGVVGHQVVYPTIDGSSIETYTTVISGTDQTVSTTWPTFGKDVGIISRLVSNAEINEQVPSLYGVTNNIGKSLLQARVRSLLAAISDLVVSGDSTNAGEFDGLLKLASNAGKSVGAGSFSGDPGVVSLGDVEWAVSQIRPGPRGRVILMGSEALHHKLSQGAYAGQISWAHDPVIGKPVRMISGVPLYRNDFIPSSGTTTLVAVSLSGDARVELIYPIASAGREITIDGPHRSEGSAVTEYTVGTNVGLVGIGDPVATVTGITV